MIVYSFINNDIIALIESFVSESASIRSDFQN